MSAGSKRRAPGNCLFVQIWYMFLSSNCTGDSDLLIFKSVYFLDIFVWTSAVQWQIRIFCAVKHVFPRKSPLRSGYLFAGLCTQVHKKCTDLDLALLYILTSGTHSKFARKNNFLVLSVCFPQTSSSAGRMFAASGSLLHHEMPCKLGSTEKPLSFVKFPTPP